MHWQRLNNRDKTSMWLYFLCFVTWTFACLCLQIPVGMLLFINWQWKYVIRQQIILISLWNYWKNWFYEKINLNKPTFHRNIIMYFYITILLLKKVLLNKLQIELHLSSKITHFQRHHYCTSFFECPLFLAMYLFHLFLACSAWKETMNDMRWINTRCIKTNGIIYFSKEV